MKINSYTLLQKLKSFMSDDQGYFNENITAAAVWNKLEQLIVYETETFPGIQTKKIVNTNAEDFGKLKTYKENDIVVWRGDQPCIGYIAKDCDCTNAKNYNDLLFSIKHFSNSLHFSNIRLATEEEVLVLEKLNSHYGCFSNNRVLIQNNEKEIYNIINNIK